MMMDRLAAGTPHSNLWRVAVGVILIACTCACSSSEQNIESTKRIERRGDTLIATGFVLTGSDAEELLSKLSDKTITRLDVGYIPGGTSRETAKLLGLMQNRAARVIGPCASACALGMMNARPLTLADDQIGSLPPLLMFHGTFRRDKERPENIKEVSRKVAQLVHKRFPYLKYEDILEAMLYEDSSSGLLITKTRDAAIQFSLCDPWPSKCRMILLRSGAVF